MAKRKKRTLSVNPFLVFLGTIVFLIVALSVTLVIIDHTGENRNAQITAWQDMFDREDGVYFVYVYDDLCAFCAQIESDIDAFQKSNAQNISLYKIDTDNVSGQMPSFIEGVPTLIIVKDGAIYDLAVGPTSILTVFNSVEKGTFNP